MSFFLAKKIFPLFFLFISFSGCSGPLLFKETRILMDTFVEVSCFGHSGTQTSDAIRDAFREIEHIEKVFNRYDRDSVISEINDLSGGQEVSVSQEVFDVIKDSIYYSRVTNGAFDITVAPLVDIWKLALKNGTIPDDEAINKVLEYTGYRNILLDEKRLSVRFLHKDTKIDLGGIAKGYAVDRARAVLLSRGVENALINIGGNIFMLGNPPHKKNWQIGIQDPRDKNKIIYKLDLKDKAISTSGTYERPHHIINPLTGRPAEDIMSVTVVADSAERADALSTAVFVMGIDEGIRFIKSIPDTEVFIFDKDGRIIKYP